MIGTTPRLLLGLTLPLLLLACSQAPTPSSGASDNPYAGGKSYPWSSRLDAPVANPYAAGRAYPWKSPTARSGTGAQGLGQGENTLSDLTWTSARSEWGPIELDRSNGEQAGNDGRPLSIGGQTFTRGLGVHAYSEVNYALGRQCTTFSAFVGVDDEVGDRGSVIFQVYGDGAKLYETPRTAMTGRDAAVPVSVNVSGVRNLRLLVLDAFDGMDYDHANWADARLNCQASAPTRTSYLSDLVYTSAASAWGPVELDRSNGEQVSNDGRALTVGGQTFAKGLGAHADSEITYPLAGNCTRFTAQVGVDDEVGDLGSVVFEVHGDGRRLYESGVRRGGDGPLGVSVDVTGVQTLRLVTTNGGDNIDYDHADWADARVTCADAQAGAPGSIDTGFGRVSPGFSVTDTAVQADGKIVVVGTAPVEGSTTSNYVVVRYNADGSLDTGFGNGGRFTANVGSSSAAVRVAVQPDGKLVVLGGASTRATSSDRVLLRLLAGGTLDSSFGTGGVVPADRLPLVSAVPAVQPDGRILVAGSVPSPISAGSYDFALFRFLADGAPDPSFGASGRVVTYAGPTQLAQGQTYQGYAQSLAVQGDGKIIVGGERNTVDPGYYPTATLLRYSGGGAPDAGYGQNGRVSLRNSRWVANVTDLEPLENGEVIAAGVTYVTECNVARVGTDGRVLQAVNLDRFGLGNYGGARKVTFARQQSTLR